MKLGTVSQLFTGPGCTRSACGGEIQMGRVSREQVMTTMQATQRVTGPAPVRSAPAPDTARTARDQRRRSGRYLHSGTSNTLHPLRPTQHQITCRLHAKVLATSTRPGVRSRAENSAPPAPIPPRPAPFRPGSRRYEITTATVVTWAAASRHVGRRVTSRSGVTQPPF